jgi:outer membrane protein assembly factor BamA
MCTGKLATATDSCDQPFVPVPGSYDFAATAETAERKPVAPDASVGAIHFTRLPIFDESNPDENNKLYRWANRFHILTKERVIEQQLLFETGDKLDNRLLDETERILRASSYIYDADIRLVKTCGNVTDVEVITRDVWSFTPDFSFTRSGGENEYRVSLRETNLLGYGKDATASFRQEDNRDSAIVSYKDPNFQGTRKIFRSNYTDSDDGSRVAVTFALPFYALDTRRSWGVGIEQYDRIDTQYFRDEDISEVRHEADLLNIHFGVSRGLIDGITRRYSIGYRFEDHVYSPGPDLPPPAEFPFDRRLSYPYLNYESVEDNFTTSLNLDQIHRTEDLHVGRRLVARLGYSHTDEPRLVIEGRLHNTLLFSPKIVLQHRVDWSGFWNFDRGDAEELLIQYGIRYYREQTKHRTLYSSFRATYTRNLSAERQVLIGGRSGLRGYPNRYQAGDRSYLFTIEERMYSDHHFFNLLRFGWAIFFDIGRAWFPDQDNGPNSEDLADVGFGIRLAPTKSNIGQVIHLDLAVPLNKHDNIDDVQFLVTIKDTF